MKYSRVISFLLVSQAPHYCHDRTLVTRSSSKMPVHDSYVRSLSKAESPSHAMPTMYSDESLSCDTSQPNDVSGDNECDELASLRDELDANLECLTIQHKFEIDELKNEIKREQQLLVHADQAYQQADEDNQNAESHNLQLRANLVKNTMQTFNIQRDLARQICLQRQQLNATNK
jgi:hydrogenase maturation factor